MQASSLLIESQSLKTRVLFVGIIILGGLFLFLSPNSTHTLQLFHRSFNTVFILGSLLAYGGVVGFLWTEDVEIFLKNNDIIVKRKNLFRSKEQIYSLDDIEKVHVATIGRAQGPHSYHLLIYRKSGGSIKTGRWSWNQSEMLLAAEQLSLQLHSFHTSGLIVHPIVRNVTVEEVPIPQTVLALGIAIFIYALWYRWQVGPWCPAMWFGSAPVVIITSSTWIFLSLLRRLPQ